MLTTLFSHEEIAALAERIFRDCCRRNYDRPGFSLLKLGLDLDSSRFRHFMNALKEALSLEQQRSDGRKLSYFSLGRFDQQVSTKFHLDGGPEDSFLMLGYEPSLIEAELSLADYSRCAADLGMTPEEFLERHNPMFKVNENLLGPYLIRLHEFNPEEFQILFINNSRSSSGWQGLLHAAVMPSPDESQRRVINSTLICPMPIEAAEILPASEIEDFLQSHGVRRRGYDKPHLNDE